MNEISLILLIEGYNIQRLTENLLFYEHFLVIVKKKKKSMGWGEDEKYSISSMFRACS